LILRLERHKFWREGHNLLRIKAVEFVELDNEQRRRAVDIHQLFSAHRLSEIEFRQSYRYATRWHNVGGTDYLYRGKRSLGPRSSELERVKAGYDEHRDRLLSRLEAMASRIEGMARVNRAMNLGRVPKLAARILRRLDSAGLLGSHLVVVGTHALFAYEAAAGIVFETGLTATADVDLLWDARRQLSVALVDVPTDGVLGLLKKVDRSFTVRRGSFRAVNADGYYVDIIRPFEADEMRASKTRIGDADDIEAAAIEGLEWLINAPKFEQIAVGDDGLPVWISCVDPRAFALHKYWVSQRDDRAPLKRWRDMAQAKAVAALATDHLRLRFDAKELSALPARIVQASAALLGPQRPA
jgi:hypothetical protein